MGVMLQWEFSRHHDDALNLERTSDLVRPTSGLSLITLRIRISVETNPSV